MATTHRFLSLATAVAAARACCAGGGDGSLSATVVLALPPVQGSASAPASGQVYMDAPNKRWITKLGPNNEWGAYGFFTPNGSAWTYLWSPNECSFFQLPFNEPYTACVGADSAHFTTFLGTSTQGSVDVNSYSDPNGQILSVSGDAPGGSCTPLTMLAMFTPAFLPDQPSFSLGAFYNQSYVQPPAAAFAPPCRCVSSVCPA